MILFHRRKIGVAPFVAGTGMPGNQDGDIRNSQLSHPGGVARTTDKNMLLVVSDNSVRSIDISGVICKFSWRFQTRIVITNVAIQVRIFACLQLPVVSKKVLKTAVL